MPGARLLQRGSSRACWCVGFSVAGAGASASRICSTLTGRALPQACTQAPFVSPLPQACRRLWILTPCAPLPPPLLCTRLHPLLQAGMDGGAAAAGAAGPALPDSAKGGMGPPLPEGSALHGAALIEGLMNWTTQVGRQACCAACCVSFLLLPACCRQQQVAAPQGVSCLQRPHAACLHFEQPGQRHSSCAAVS